MKELIIDRPDLQTARQRVLFGSMTVFFWAIWIYLWLPILALIGWTLGFRIAYEQMVVLNGYTGLLHLLKYYLAVIFCLAATLLCWAYYNFWRFRGVNRRAHAVSVGIPMLSQRYHVAQQTLESWTGARRLVLHHDAEGKLILDGTKIQPSAS